MAPDSGELEGKGKAVFQLSHLSVTLGKGDQRLSLVGIGSSVTGATPGRCLPLLRAGPASLIPGPHGPCELAQSFGFEPWSQGPL